MFRVRAVALAVLVATSMVAMAATPGVAQDSGEAEAYAGANVTFETTSNALVGYQVDGETVVEEVRVDAESAVSADAGLGTTVGLDAITSIAGASIEQRTEARASVSLELESGAELRANDNDRGVLQIHAGEEDQIATVNVSANAQADQQADDHVVVHSESGAEGAIVVIGEGTVSVNQDGHVTAEIAADSQLVYRQYQDDRSDDDAERERMIADGAAAAEVYVQADPDDTAETVADVVSYAGDTTVEVTHESQDRVEMTAERAQAEGKVLIASVSEATFENAEGLEVYVDGEAATHVETMSEVELSVEDADEPRYHVAQSTSTESTVDVAIGLDGFSERSVTMTAADDTDAEDPDTDDPATDDPDADDADDIDDTGDDDIPGFGALVALVAILSLAVGVRYR